MNMPRALKLFAAVLVAVLGTAACTGHGREAPRPREITYVRVENQAWLDVDVFALGTAGQRTRLGSVTGNSQATLRIPDSIVGLGRELQFLVDPVGSRVQGTSFNIFVSPGSQVRLTVPPSFGR
jgi:hypothetical protein